MRMMDGFRGCLWTVVLLLAALSTCLAEGGSPDGSIPPALSANNSTNELNTTVSPNTTQAATTTKPAIANTTTASAPKTSPSTSTAAPPPASPTTKGPTPASTSTSTTVTTKGTTTPTATSSTTISLVTSTVSSGTQKISGFDLGSFIGGIVLMLSILAVVYFGCRFYNSRRGVRYRTIDEHEAII